MTVHNDPSSRAWWGFAAGGLLILLAVILFALDTDPAWLFQSPLASGLLAILGIGVLAWSWRLTRPPASR